MAVQIKRRTVEEFDTLVMLPENADKSFEFIGGEIIQMVSNNYSSETAALMIFFIQTYLRQSGTRGRITGADGGYIIGGERYIPDVAYISYQKQPEPSHDAYNPNPPDLVVEVVSPTDSERQLSIKISNYLAAGAIVWVARPDVKEVDAHTPGQAVQVLGINGMLDGGDVLPNFKLSVREIFPEESR